MPRTLNLTRRSQRLRRRGYYNLLRERNGANVSNSNEFNDNYIVNYGDENNSDSASTHFNEEYFANRNNCIVDQSIAIDLSSHFKAALSNVPGNFNTYTCGDMNFKCVSCNASHFESERTNRDMNIFTSCCHKGKVHLEPFTRNDFFLKLYKDLNSSDPNLKKRAVEYFINIRRYNSAFAMVSSQAKIDETVCQGVYYFKIHDIFYHRSGPLIPSSGKLPVYAQLYFYDVETATSYRLQNSSNSNCCPQLMKQIAHELNSVNPYVKSFISMYELTKQPGNQYKDIRMEIKVTRDCDLRRYNDAISTDVAVIFTSNDGEPSLDRHLISFSKNSTGQTLKHVSILSDSLDPLAYPLLFPNGDKGWRMNMEHSLRNTNSFHRSTITMLQYTCYRIALRDEFSLLHKSQKLFLQWIVDMYVRVESSRLKFIKDNQRNLRSDLYDNLTGFLNDGDNDRTTIGRKVVLPSSFIGSPRNMHQNYLDAMCIVQHFGKPSLFITMACNPNWKEIHSNIDYVEKSFFRPDIVVRVFKLKLKELIADIISKNIFGKAVALIYTIEFQKRGLPHAHILLTLSNDDKIGGASDIDKVVCAEIPDKNIYPQLYEFVKTHMMHGPCGSLNTNAVCMRDGKCSKEFPKAFCQSTREAVNGYPLYKRSDNGVSVHVRNCDLDNRYVVPYNPYLLAKFDCHINVEVCTTVKSVKYIYKYVYKGYDCATIEVGQGNDSEYSIDEVKNFLNCRYVGSSEAMWRIYELPLHYQSHTIIRLHIHLPGRQSVHFNASDNQKEIIPNIRRAVGSVSRTKLLAYFLLNQEDIEAHNFKYTEIPLHYTWIDKEKKWRKRLRGRNNIIARMFSVSPKDVELFHLRLLLLHSNAATSFEDLKTYNGIIYDSFLAARHARSIASNENEWRECLNEAKEFQSPKRLRNMFGFICALNLPPNALQLWQEFKDYLCEDFLHIFEVEIAYNRGLLEIEEILITHNISCQSIGLPSPNAVVNNSVDHFDFRAEEQIFMQLYSEANEEQKYVIDQVVKEVLHQDTGCNVFCLSAYAGCGKTYTQRAIIHKLQSVNLRCIATAFSGIASTLLIGGKTLHNVFKLPIPILDTSVANISAGSSYANYIKSASLIIIDEISMCPLGALKIIDNLLRDLADGEDKSKLFGNKTILMCGDFRQILPVVPHGSRTSLIENCITSWDHFHFIRKLTLTQNMRALPEEIEFMEFLKAIGNGEKQFSPTLEKISYKYHKTL